MPFKALGLAEPIARALEQAHYTVPTPIQAKAIPVALAGGDLIGIAQTGTGKTAAFALPILHRLAATQKPRHPKSCRALVLSPTRELSSQIADSFAVYGRNLRMAVRLAIGGVPIGKQIRGLAGGADVLVATPGRLLDLCKSRAVSLDHVEFFVLDEADRMLDMGFIPDIRRIVAMLPKRRQTLFFSATMAPEVSRLAEGLLSGPTTVGVTPPASIVTRIEQRAVFVSRADKPIVLAKLLSEQAVERALVFTRTKHGADKVVRGLEKAGIPAEVIHGNRSQGQRERALAAFRSGSVRNLIATDIAARGIDVPGISHVFNYDIPEVPETYVHRIGRTARAGKDGVAISLCSPDETPLFRSIEKLAGERIAVTGESSRREPQERQRVAEVPTKRVDQRNRGRSRQPSPPNHGGDIAGVAFLRREQDAPRKTGGRRRRRSGSKEQPQRFLPAANSV